MKLAILAAAFGLIVALPLVADPLPMPREVHRDLYGDPLPDGAVLRLGTTRFRAPRMAGVAFRKSGELVAVTESGTIHVWPADGSHIATTMQIAGEKSFGRMAMSPDARFVAAMTDRGIAVWDISESKPIEFLNQSFGVAIEFCFSRTNKWLSASNYDAGVILFDLGRKSWTKVPVQASDFAVLSFSHDEQSLVITGRKEVIVVEASSGAIRCRVPMRRPHCSALSADGSMLAVLPSTSFGHSPEGVKIFAVPSGEAIATMKPPTGNGRWIQFMPDGKHLMMGTAQSVLEWDLVKGTVVRESMDAFWARPVISSDGHMMAAHSDSAAIVWNLKEGKLDRRDARYAGHSDTVYHTAVSSDGKLIATGSRGHDVIVWDASTSQLLSRLPSEWAQGNRMQFLPRTDSIITIGPDRVSPTIWDARTGRTLKQFIPRPEMAKTESSHDIRFSRDLKTVTTTTQPNSLPGKVHRVRWDLATGQIIERIETNDRMAALEWESPRAVSPDGEWVVQSGQLSRTNGQGAEELLQRKETMLVPAKFSDDSRFVAIPHCPRETWMNGPDVGGLSVFDLASKKLIAELTTGQAFRFAFSPDGLYIAVVGRTKVMLWDMLSGQNVLDYTSVRNRNFIGNISFTPDGRRLVTGHEDSTATVWNMTGRRLSEGVAIPRLSAKELAGLWDDLANPMSVPAHRAGWELTCRPDQAIALFKERLKVAKTPSPDAIRELIARLDSPKFRVREDAEKKLLEIGSSIVPALKAAQSTGLTAEQSVRVDRIITAATVPSPMTDFERRLLRAVAILSRIDTSDATDVLREVVYGATDSRLTQDARMALRRRGLAGSQN